MEGFSSLEMVSFLGRIPKIVAGLRLSKPWKLSQKAAPSGASVYFLPPGPYSEFIHLINFMKDFNLGGEIRAFLPKLLLVRMFPSRK